MKKKILILVFFSLFFAYLNFSFDWMNKGDKKKTFNRIQLDFYKDWNNKISKRSHPRRGIWKQFKRWEWFARTRLSKEGYFVSGLNWQGWLEKKKLKRKKILSSSKSGDWKELGPFTIPDGNYCKTGGYRGLGRINCISFDPLNPDIIWAGAPSGGLWMSLDGGKNWSSNTDDLPNLGVSSILIHPSNNQIMYLATGDGDAGDTFSIGILKSIDGGANWFQVGNNLELNENIRISKMVMHPNNPDTILIASNLGIYKITGSGTNWSKKASGVFKDIEVVESSPNIWFAAPYQEAGIYRSSDSGETWDKILKGLPEEFSSIGRTAVAVSKSSPNIIYMLIAKGDHGFFALFRSTDGGHSWSMRSNSPNILGWDSYGNDIGGQSWYDMTLDVDPDNKDIIYVGGVNLWKSVDGGVSWSINTYLYEGSQIPYVHADHHAFKFYPENSNIIFSGNDGGIFKSENKGESWEDLSNGLAIHQIYRLGLSKKEHDIIIIGNQDNGSDLYKKGTWHSVNWADGMECAIDPEDSKIMYTSIYNGSFYKSIDGGQSWVGISPDSFDGNGAWVTPFLIKPGTPSTLFTVTDKVYQSLDRGETWNAISGSLVSTENPFTCMAISEKNPDYIYVSNLTEMFYTHDGGKTWNQISQTTLPASPITGIAIDPDSPTTIWITLGAYASKKKVYRSGDSGKHWMNMSGIIPNIPVNCINIDSDSRAVYIGTDLGVFYSIYGDSNWTAFDKGLPNIIVNEMEIHYASKKIRAATYGRGVWESSLGSQPALFPPVDIEVHRNINRSLLQVEYVDKLSWKINSKNNDTEIIKYLIYKQVDKDLEKIAEVNSGVFELQVREAKNMDTVYYISALNIDNIESSKIAINISEQK